MKNKGINLIIGISLNAIAIILVIFLVYSIGNKAFAFGAKVFNEQSIDSVSASRDVEVTIPMNVTSKQLAKILYAKDLIEDINVFYVQVELSDFKNKFLAGTYTLKTSMTASEMMQSMCAPTTESTE